MRPLAACAVLAWLAAPVPSQDVPALIRQLGDKETAQRVLGANGLAALGSKAAAAVPALAQALADAESPVRQAAGKALGKVGKAAMPRIKEAFGDTSRK